MRKDLVPSKLSNLYASIIDQRRFTSLSSIMWDEFSMLGQFEINGLENFILAMQQLENYQSTMHQVMNIQGEWEEDLYKGETYCIASHFFDEDNKPHKLDINYFVLRISKTSVFCHLREKFRERNLAVPSRTSITSE